MTFTANGLSVNCCIFSTLACTKSTGSCPVPITPSPPALETADAKSASATQAIAPWIIGYSTPMRSQKSVFTKGLLPLLID